MSTVDPKEYAECRKRGHSASNVSLTSDPPWSVCEHCGMPFRYEQTLVEAYAAPGRPATPPDADRNPPLEKIP